MIAAAAARRQDRKRQEWSRRNAALFTDSVEADLRASLDAWRRDHQAQHDEPILTLSFGEVFAIEYAGSTTELY